MYIGSTKSLKSRKYKHFYQLKKGNHHSIHLQNSYNKYGKDKFAFYILERCTIDNRKERELYYINFNKSYKREFGYNIYEPNEDNFKCSNETIEKIRKAHEKIFVSVDVYDIQGNFLNSFDSSIACSKYYDFSSSSIISEILKKKRKSYKGMTFVKKGEPFNYTSSLMQRDMSKFYK